jgi:hypothetical protein
LTRVTNLQILSLNNSDANLRYVTWQDKTDIHLVLLDHGKTSANLTIQDAYQPNLRIEPNWQFEKRPVLIFTYRQGAAAELAQLYGLDTENALIPLDEMLGEQIEWRIGENGTALLSVYTKADATLRASCYRFDNNLHKLTQSKCE